MRRIACKACGEHLSSVWGPDYEEPRVKGADIVLVPFWGGFFCYRCFIKRLNAKCHRCNEALTDGEVQRLYRDLPEPRESQELYWRAFKHLLDGQKTCHRCLEAQEVQRMKMRHEREPSDEVKAREKLRVENENLRSEAASRRNFSSNSDFLKKARVDTKKASVSVYSDGTCGCGRGREGKCPYCGTKYK